MRLDDRLRLAAQRLVKGLGFRQRVHPELAVQKVFALRVLPQRGRPVPAFRIQHDQALMYRLVQTVRIQTAVGKPDRLLMLPPRGKLLHQSVQGVTVAAFQGSPLQYQPRLVFWVVRRAYAVQEGSAIEFHGSNQPTGIADPIVEPAQVQKLADVGPYLTRVKPDPALCGQQSVSVGKGQAQMCQQVAEIAAGRRLRHIRP